MSSDLPQPTAERWQPLRLGLIELYHYDVEEFWFDDGHLLLRGNNGTGKSKVLSLTLPFLLDASLSAARLEPDADPNKRMEWNLLMGGRFDRRTGYAWVEFGRRAADGTPAFFTLGAGLRATAGRPGVDSWFFTSDSRLGADWALVDDAGLVTTRDRLSETLGSPNVYTTARDYRRAVDKRLFGLGEQRYRALIDTLIQLRQPQLSKQPNENNLSRALSQAFSPMARSVLDDVAEAMNQLDENRDELEDHELMQTAVARFNASYTRYAQILARRRARSLRQAQTAFDVTSAAVRDARADRDQAQITLEDNQSRLNDTQARHREIGDQIQVLQDSPEMRSARELQRARETADQTARIAEQTEQDERRARERSEKENAALVSREQASRRTHDRLSGAIADSAAAAYAAGVGDGHRASWGETADPDDLAGHSAQTRRAITDAQRRLVATRDDQIRQIRRGLAEVDQKLQIQRGVQHERDARREDSEAAEADLRSADQAQEQAAGAYIDAWQTFGEAVADTLGPDVTAAWPDAADALADWVRSLDGDPPLTDRWQIVADDERERIAAAESRAEQQQAMLEGQRDLLVEERTQLRAGKEEAPPPPLTREAERAGRPGAPLWQLVDFRDSLDASSRAGVEAALQAAGLLDGWVTPAGELLAADTYDNWLVARAPQANNLGAALQVADPAGAGQAAPVAAGHVESILSAVALVESKDTVGPEAAESWVALDGRYRIGAVQGAWAKPAAEYIGYTAREAARQRRLAQIERELRERADRLQAIADRQAGLAERRAVLGRLQSQRPSTDALRTAHAQRAAADRRAAAAREQLVEAEHRLEHARQALARSRESLLLDAEDVDLPIERDALESVAGHLRRYELAVAHAESALREHALARVEQTEQAERDAAARTELAEARERAETHRQQADAEQAQHDELARSVGARVEDLTKRLNERIGKRQQLDDQLKSWRAALTEAHKRLGATEQAVIDAEQRQTQEQGRRGEAVAAFQAFAATGLLEAAAPTITIPAHRGIWTIDPALATARSAEAELAEIDDDEAQWQRIQNRVGNEFGELQRALSARGYQSYGEPSDHGFIVRITFNQHEEAPAKLQALLEREIAERRQLLTAKETEIIENHLQAEVAAQLQSLMRNADARVSAINGELDKRPTSTGVKFRLVWQGLPDADSGLADLVEVRKLLLHKISDAWSAADRARVGRFLQKRIDAERERDPSGARIDQLANALDYRAWHRFRVQRWQDGQWKPLSGPASSGERALGLTVPLFAAAASHYESASAHAPRLVLLDEAYAGIDDGARAHCMSLIREFGLDFVMTSEREWGCYAELPGVAIAHLVRRADVDAVFVSRWRWNGRSREAMAAPLATIDGSA